MNVHWTNTATDHLAAIFSYLSQDSQTYALRAIDRLTKRSEQLAVFPLSGRVVPELQREDIREVVERPYRLIYRVTEEGVDILAIVHSAQVLPTNL